MLPVENTTYGRVADMHRLLLQSGLHIIDEAFVRVRIALMALPGTALSEVKTARGHLVILPQCRSFLDAHNIRPEAHADNAGAAAEIAERQEKGVAALASTLAAETYGLDIRRNGISELNFITCAALRIFQ